MTETQEIPTTDAPDPDDPRKPDSPDDLTKRSWKFVLRKTLREFTDDECTDLAAALTYYAVLAIFPALLALVSLLSLVGQADQTSEALLGIVEDLGPATAVEALREPLEQLTRTSAAGWALVAGLLGAVWSASGYVGAFSRAMNRIYEIEEGRPFWKLRPVMIIITLGAVLLIGIVLVLLVLTGPLAEAIGNALGFGETAITVWGIAKWPVLFLVVALIVAVLYHATPNVQQPKFRWISIGALAAIVVWVVASVLFGVYVANFSSYNKTYGSLAGIIVFLLWLWITNLALLFGAELNAEIERGRELQAGIAAEEEIQLPPRDTRKITKAAAKDAKDVAQAREIRDDHSEITQPGGATDQAEPVASEKPG
jgi:membrane protein